MPRNVHVDALRILEAGDGSIKIERPDDRAAILISVDIGAIGTLGTVAPSADKLILRGGSGEGRATMFLGAAGGLTQLGGGDSTGVIVYAGAAPAMSIDAARITAILPIGLPADDPPAIGDLSAHVDGRSMVRTAAGPQIQAIQSRVIVPLCWPKLEDDATPTDTTDLTFAVVFPYSVTILAAGYIPRGALTSDDVSYAQLNFNLLDPAAPVALAGANTKTFVSGGTGDWIADEPVMFDLFETVCGSDYAIQFQVSKPGVGGVAVPRGLAFLHVAQRNV